MNLKSDIRIKILNDRYRLIDLGLYVFKKKTNKQNQTKKKKEKKNMFKCENQ